jgi:hypothetical protein
MDDQKIRQELEWVSNATAGAEGAKNLTKAITQVEQKLKDVAAAEYELAGASQAAGGYELVPSVLDKVAKVAPQAEAGLRKVTAATQAAAVASEKLVVSAGQAHSKVANLGQVGLQTGRVIQDFAQGGVGGILNNIEGFAMAVGGGPGLAGVLTGLGVAAFIAKPLIVSAAESIGMFGNEAETSKTKVEKLTERIDELSKQKVKLAIDVRELKVAEEALVELKKARAEFEAPSASSDQAEAGKRIGKAIDETGEGDEIKKELVADILADLNRDETKLQREGKEARADLAQRKADLAENPTSTAGQGAVDAAQKLVENLETAEKLAQLNREQEASDIVGRMLVKAKSGKDPEAASRLAEGLDKAGHEDVATEVRKATPATVKAEREKKERETIAETARKETEAADKETVRTKKAADDEVDRLNEQGQTNQEIGRKELAAQNKKAADTKAAARKPADAARSRAVTAAEAELKRGTVDEEATAGAADFRARGEGTAEQQRDALEAQIRARIKKSNPKLGALPAAQIASNLAAEAFAKVDREKGDLVNAGLGEAAANQMILMQTNEVLMNELNKTRNDIRRLGNALSGQLDRARSGQKSRVN